jgi:hypothetical protein
MDRKLLFSFEDLGSKSDAATKILGKQFARHGCDIAQGGVSPGVKRSSGVSYREMLLTFKDSQTVLLRIKQSGDIFEVRVNGGAQPIRHQDDHVKAVIEIVDVLDAGRKKFQAKLAAAATKPPPGLRTAAPKIEQALAEKRDSLKEAIAAVREEIAALSVGAPALA